MIERISTSQAEIAVFTAEEVYDLALKGDVLVRWNSFSFPLETADGKAFDALKELSKLPKRSPREWAVAFTHQGQRYQGRLCAIRKNAVATARAQEKLRKQARKKQKQVAADALKLAAFVVVFTTGRHVRWSQ